MPAVSRSNRMLQRDLNYFRGDPMHLRQRVTEHVFGAWHQGPITALDEFLKRETIAATREALVVST